MAPAASPWRYASGDSAPVGRVRSVRVLYALPATGCEPLLEFQAGSNCLNFAGLCSHQFRR